MERLLEKFGKGRISGLKGLYVDARIPITEEVLNEALQENLVSHNHNVRHMKVSIREHNILNVDLGFRLGFLTKTFNFDARVDENIDFKTTPKLIITLSGAGLPLGMLTRLANSILEVLPKGIDVTGRRIEVNIATMLTDRDLDYLIPFVRQANVDTASGNLILHLVVEVH